MSNINYKSGWLKSPESGEKIAPKTTTDQVLTNKGTTLTDELNNNKSTEQGSGYVFAMDNLSGLGGIKVFGKGKQKGNQLWKHGDITFTGQKSYEIKLQPGTYTFSAEISSTDTDAATNLVYMLNGAVRSEMIRGQRTSYTFTLPEYCNTMALYASNGSNASTGDTVTFKNVMLNPGDFELPLEEYVGGITANNPQSVIYNGQRLVEGNQLFDASHFLTTTLNDTTLTNNGNGSFTFSSNSSDNPSGAFGRYDLSHEEMVRLFKVGDLYMDCKGASNPYFALHIKNSTKTYVEIGNLSSPTGKLTITQEMLDDEDAYLCYGFYGYSNKPFTPVTVKPMLFQDGDGTWEPYTGGVQTIIDDNIDTKLLKRNHFNINEALKLENWEVTDLGVNNGYRSFKVEGLKPNTEYTFSFAQNNFTENEDYYMCINNANITDWSNYPLVHPSATMQKTKQTLLSSDEGCIYLVVYNAHNAGILDYIFEKCTEPQLELGAERTTYVKYEEQVLESSTQNGLKGVPLGKIIPSKIANSPVHMAGVYWDNIDGQYYIADYKNYCTGENVQLITEFTVDGGQEDGQSWWDYPTYNGFGRSSILPFTDDRRDALCNQLNVISKYRTNYGLKMNDSIWIGVENNVIYAIYNSFYDTSLEDHGLANWKAHLDENPLVITTWLDEPIVTPISVEEMAQYNALVAYNPTTTFISEAHIEVVGLKNVDSWDYINNTFAKKSEILTNITIPAGRMKGDVDGDGKITSNDADLVLGYFSNEAELDEIQLQCAEISGDNMVEGIDARDAMEILKVFNNQKTAGYLGGDVLGNWTVNPNYATEEMQFYTDITVDGMTENSSAVVTVKGSYEFNFFNAVCGNGYIRIYAKLCPIDKVDAVVQCGNDGNGTAIVVQEKTELPIPAASSEDEGKILRVVNGSPAWALIANAEEASF